MSTVKPSWTDCRRPSPHRSPWDMLQREGLRRAPAGGDGAGPTVGALAAYPGMASSDESAELRPRASRTAAATACSDHRAHELLLLER